jgi:hypothetical protein
MRLSTPGVLQEYSRVLRRYSWRLRGQVQQPLGLTEHAFDALLMSALLLSTGFDPATMPPLKPGAAGAALVAEVGALFVGCAHATRRRRAGDARIRMGERAVATR